MNMIELYCHRDELAQTKIGCMRWPSSEHDEGVDVQDPTKHGVCFHGMSSYGFATHEVSNCYVFDYGPTTHGVTSHILTTHVVFGYGVGSSSAHIGGWVHIYLDDGFGPS